MMRVRLGTAVLVAGLVAGWCAFDSSAAATELYTIRPLGAVVAETGGPVANVVVFLRDAAGEPICATEPVTVDWRTVDGFPNTRVAQAGRDYVAATGTATFNPGECQTTVPIDIVDDTVDEWPLLWGEWLLVAFSNPSPNAVINTTAFFGLGLVIIIDDDTAGADCDPQYGNHHIALSVQLNNCDLYGADLSGAPLSFANVSEADLTGANLSGAGLYYTDFTGADLADADLSGASIYFADFAGADLTNADLSDALGVGASFTGANLAGANLTDAFLEGAHFDGALLTGARLTGADFVNADFVNADLTGADLDHADLTGADLTGADLVNADLTLADLADANLTNVDLSWADLTAAYLWGADLSGVIWWNTTCPDGTNSNTNIFRSCEYNL